MPNTKLYEKVQSAVKHYLEQIEHNRLRDNFTAAASIYRRQLEKLERDNPQGNLAALQGQDSIFELLNKANVHAL